MRPVIDVGQLLAASLSLARSAGQIIRDVSRSGRLEVVDKADPTATPLRPSASVDDPMTVADIASQRLIVGGLLSLFPGLTVVGEEDVPAVAAALPPSLDAAFDLGRVPPDLRAVPLDDVCV